MILATYAIHLLSLYVHMLPVESVLSIARQFCKVQGEEHRLKRRVNQRYIRREGPPRQWNCQTHSAKPRSDSLQPQVFL